MPSEIIDLFCGIGGLTRGLIDSGLNVIADLTLILHANTHMNITTMCRITRRMSEKFTRQI